MNKVSGERCSGATASISPRYLFTTASQLTSLSLFLIDNLQMAVMMSEFLLLCADATLCDPTSSATWGSLNFCLLIQQFKVHTIQQALLTALSQAGAWGNTEKPRNNVAFLLITPSLAVGCERIFGLMAVWVHPHQTYLMSMVEAA